MPLCLFCYSLYCGIKISFVIYINLKSFYRHICNWKLKYWQTINIIGGEHFSCVELNTMFFGLKSAKILLVHAKCEINYVILLYCYSNIRPFSIVLYQFSLLIFFVCFLYISTLILYLISIYTIIALPTIVIVVTLFSVTYFLLLPYRERATNIAVAIVESAIIIWKRIHKRSHEPMYKTDTR